MVDGAGLTTLLFAVNTAQGSWDFATYIQLLRRTVLLRRSLHFSSASASACCRAAVVSSRSTSWSVCLQEVPVPVMWGVQHDRYDWPWEQKQVCGRPEEWT